MPKAQLQFLDDTGAALFTAAVETDATFLPRFLAAYHPKYGQVPVDPTANPVVMRDMTDLEVIKKFAGDWLVYTIGIIQTHEAAPPAPTPIQFTPV